jgi:hypothetical protein
VRLTARIGTAYVDVGGDFSRLRRELAAFKDRGVQVNVTANIDRSSFTRAQAAGARLGGKEEVKLRADVDVSSFARAKAVMAVLSKQGSQLTDVFDRSHLSIGQWTGILTAALPVVVDLAGALGALTASLGAATAGLGALGVGGAGAGAVGFGGIAAIAAPALSSLKDLIAAQTTLNKSRATGAGAASRAAAASTQQITAAEDQLASAQRSEKIAQDALNIAREEAVRQLQDMKRAALESGTSEKRARLSLLQAEQNLRKLRRDGSASTLDIRDAELSVVEARQNVKDVSIDAERAQADYNKAQKDGVSKMPGVVSAQRSYDDAVRATAQANQDLADTQKKANALAGAGATQQAALALAQKKAGPAAVKFAHNLKEMTKDWRRLTAAGREDFFGLLGDGLDRLNQKLPLFAKSANTSMKALRGGFDDFLKKATGPEFDHFIEVMTRTFAKSIGPISRGFGNIAKVLERIAVAVAPDIVKMARGFEDMTENWVKSTRNAADLRDIVHKLVGQTKSWWDLLVAAKDLIVAVLVPGMGQGQKAVEGMTDQLKEWTAWANAHPKEIRDFFKEGLETTRKLAEALLSFLPSLFEITKAARPISRLFLVAVKALNSLKIGNVSALTALIGVVVGTKLILGINKIRLAFLALKDAAFGAKAAEVAATTVPPVTTPTVGGGGGLVMREGKVTTVAEAEKAGGTWGQRFAQSARGAMLPVFGGLGIAIAGSIAVQPILKKFHEIAEKAADDFPGPFEGIGKTIAGLGIPDELLPSIPKHPGGILGLLGVGKEGPDDLNDLAKGVIGAKTALKGLDRVLEGLSTMEPQDAIVALRKKYGSLVVAGHEMSKKQRIAFEDMMRAARENGDITQNQLEQVTRSFDQNSSKWGRMMERAARATGQSTRSMKRAVGDMSVKVSKDYEGMVEVTGGGLHLLTENTNRALGALGIKKSIKWNIAHGGTSNQIAQAGGGGARQRGGMVPGTGFGDKIRAKLPIGSGVINRKAVDVLLEPREIALPPEKVRRLGGPKAIERINKIFPRFGFQRGGVVDRTGVQHFQKGGMAAMISEANKFEHRHFPYVWGGGHGSFGVQPVDCSGAVSDILHAAGLLKAPMVSGDLAHWGKAGRGSLTVYANPEHTFMSLAGRYFGTSSSNPGGGAGWIDAGFSRGYLSGFAARTMDAVSGLVDKIKRVILKGPDGPLKDTGQASLDKAWRASNRYLAKNAPGGFGGGQALVDGGNWEKVTGGTLSFRQLVRLSKDAGLPSPLFAHIAEAESGGRVGVINEIGATGLWQIYNHPDLVRRFGSMTNAWHNAQAAKVLFDQSGTQPWVASQGAWGRFAQKGGMIPFGGYFDRGGVVPGREGEPVPIIAHAGETIVPKLQKGGVIERGMGLEQIKRLRKHVGEQMRKVIPKLDERIDITERLAALTSSPQGAELSKGELAKQVTLQQKLLDSLRKTLHISQRGMETIERTIKRIEREIKKLERKIQAELRRDKPDHKKIREWREDLGTHKRAMSRLPITRQSFRESIIELSGLTGRGGRIFDTKLALKELKASGTAEPLHIAELLEFAEALRFGAFRRLPGLSGPARELPTFHQGGIVPGRIGQSVPIMAQGGEVVVPNGSSAAHHFDVRVFVGNQEIKDITRVEIKDRERRQTSRYRAGVRP